MIRRRIQALVWDDALQDYVPLPLDDADSFTIQLARLVNGRPMDDNAFKAILDRLQSGY